MTRIETSEETCCFVRMCTAQPHRCWLRHRECPFVQERHVGSAQGRTASSISGGQWQTVQNETYHLIVEIALAVSSLLEHTEP